MTILKSKWGAAAVLGAAVLGIAPSAHANLEQCGGCFVSLEAACEFRPTEECMTQCMTVAVETSCAAEIYTSCETGCTATATTECATTCSDVCTTDCEQQVAAEQPPNCMGLCMSSCQQDCTDENCPGTAKGPCRACCAHNCSDKCEAQCKDEPEVVTECTPTCTKACTGSCTAEANLQCQVDCQTQVYQQCETEMVETCQTECETTGGAIFCDGQFLNASDIEACADEILAEIDIDVALELDVDIDIDTETDPEACESESCETVDEVGDEVDEICSVAQVGTRTSGKTALALFGLSVLGAVWRARRRR